MTTAPTAEGSLYELVARGNKDVFFYQDLFNSKFAFDNTYETQTPSTQDLRRVPPRTAAEFGRTVEFDFDLVGDVMTNPALLITLPTWLPPTVAALAHKSLITDTSGVSYGYTSGIAYFLFERIQFFQDTILLQEFSGDALWAKTANEGTYASTFIASSQTGHHDNSLLSVSRNGALPMLRLELPLIGCQTADDCGFPQRATTAHSYRLRCKLRKLEDLVESSDGRHKPTPWGRQDFQQGFSKNGAPTTFATIPREQIGPLLLQLETNQVYLPREHQDVLQKKPQRIQFKRIFENVYTQNQSDYQGVQNGGASYITRRIDGRHPAERLLWFARAIKDINANQLWKLQTFYTTLNLTIAGQTRETDRAPMVWRDLNNFAKEELDTGNDISTMNWGFGAIAEKRQDLTNGQITGAVNFTTADRPTFYISLAQATVDPFTGAPNTELRVLVESWAAFDTDGKGRAELFSFN
jgi:hypothetical protein